MDRIVTFAALPACALGVAAASPARRWATRLLRFHALVVALLLVVYARLKRRFARNLRAPPPDALDAHCSTFEHGGMRLLAYRPARAPRATIVVCPGVSNCVHRTLRLAVVGPFLDEYAVVTFQPRGLGDSAPGFDVTTASLLQDADDVCALVRARGPDDELRLIGFSLGGFVAAQLLAHRPEWAARAVLVGTMCDGTSMPLSMRVATAAMGVRNDRHLARVGQPVLLVHSADDETIAPDEMERNARIRRQRALPTTVCGASGRHAHYALDAEQARTVREFLA